MVYGYEIWDKNIRSLHWGSSLVRESKELSKYMLYLIGAQKVRQDRGGAKPAGEYTEYTLFYGKGNEKHELGTGFLVHMRIISAVKMAEFVSNVIHILSGP
jgi:hypothetical protein